MPGLCKNNFFIGLKIKIKERITTFVSVECGNNSEHFPMIQPGVRKVDNVFLYFWNHQ